MDTSHSTELTRDSSQVMNFECAKFSTRVLGTLLDWLILLGPSFIVSAAIPYVGWFLLVVLYYVALECSPAQATIGKRVMGIKVVDKKGEAITASQSYIRRLMSVISSSMLGIGHLLALFTQKKQALQDIVADAYVVYGDTGVSIVDAWIVGIRKIFGVK